MTMKIQKSKKTLPQVSRSDVDSAKQGAAINTDVATQKTTSLNSLPVIKQTEVTPVKTRSESLDKSLKLTEDTLAVLWELSEVTGMSERKILGKLTNEALEMMKIKLDAAKEFDMTPTVTIKPRKS